MYCFISLPGMVCHGSRRLLACATIVEGTGRRHGGSVRGVELDRRQETAMHKTYLEASDDCLVTCCSSLIDAINPGARKKKTQDEDIVLAWHRHQQPGERLSTVNLNLDARC